MNKAIIVTGSSGFISYHLINYYLEKNFIVYGLDKRQNKLSKKLLKNKKFKFYKINLSDEKKVFIFLKKIKNKKFDALFHFAANSDISKGVSDYKIELNDTFLTTINSVTICKKLQIKKYIFSSSSAIFGYIKNKINELSSPLRPISNYGAMKLSSESYIYSSVNNFDKILVIRFPNVIGPYMTHGLLYDLGKKINNANKKIKILGNGSQRKPYIYVKNLIYYIDLLYNKNLKNKINVYNIGPNDNGITVKNIVNLMLKNYNLKKIIPEYEKKKEGWLGDVTKYSYNNKLIRKTLKISIPSTKESILKTIYENKKIK